MVIVSEIKVTMLYILYWNVLVAALVYNILSDIILYCTWLFCFKMKKKIIVFYTNTILEYLYNIIIYMLYMLKLRKKYEDKSF